MSKRAIVLYLHVHQPFRVRPYSVFDTGINHNYFSESEYFSDTNDQRILEKVAEKSYLPTNEVLLRLLQKHPDFKISLSITGTVLEQMRDWAPQVLESFKELVKTGKVEILSETYYHSLAFFYSRFEFIKQVRMHEELVRTLFGVTPTAFRNTELAYNNELAQWADKAGYKAIISEGWDPVLGWRSPNHVYRPSYTENIKLLMKNYRLSDDIAFRFGDRSSPEWPLSAEKYCHWIDQLHESDSIINLFMDYETFGEHQWKDSGIFTFLEELPEVFLRQEGNSFMTISEAADGFEPVGEIDVPATITWADTERDLTAWLGNDMQKDVMHELYELENDILSTEDHGLIQDWRRLQTSDHAYYMCTKWFKDGDVHAYFSPYDSPFDAFIYYSNALRDLKLRIIQFQEAHA
jgi:alpha-amylase